LLESKALALALCWSPKLQLWRFAGVQSFSFGALLESKALALALCWSPKLQLWRFAGVQSFSFGKSKPKGLDSSLAQT
jgi:hypothetical protein